MAGEEDEYEIYSKKSLKAKLQQKLGDHVFFNEVNGKRNIVCFRHCAKNEVFHEGFLQ